MRRRCLQLLSATSKRIKTDEGDTVEVPDGLASLAVELAGWNAELAYRSSIMHSYNVPKRPPPLSSSKMPV